VFGIIAARWLDNFIALPLSQCIAGNNGNVVSGEYIIFVEDDIPF